MKDKLAKVLRSSWEYANSNVGAAIIGATSAYILTKGSTEEELAIAKGKLDRSREENRELEKLLKESDHLVKILLNSKMDMSSNLQNCLRKKNGLEYAYQNSSFFFKQKCTEESLNDNIAPNSKK